MKKWNEKFLENNVAKDYIPLSDEFWDDVEKYSLHHPKEFEYPNKSDFKKHQNYIKENFKGTLKEIECAIESAKIDDENEYKDSLEKYHRFDYDLINLVKYKTSMYYSEINEKQFDIIWDKSWSDGHSDGLYSVKCYFEDYVDMFDKLKELEN